MNKTFYHAEQQNMNQEAPTLLVINIHGHCPIVARYRNRLKYDKKLIFSDAWKDSNPNLHAQIYLRICEAGLYSFVIVGTSKLSNQIHNQICNL
jgi:hypothetical protein